jgi:hypothetical protein
MTTQADFGLSNRLCQPLSLWFLKGLPNLKHSSKIWFCLSGLGFWQLGWAGVYLQANYWNSSQFAQPADLVSKEDLSFFILCSN